MGKSSNKAPVIISKTSFKNPGVAFCSFVQEIIVLPPLVQDLVKFLWLRFDDLSNLSLAMQSNTSEAVVSSWLDSSAGRYCLNAVNVLQRTC